MSKEILDSNDIQRAIRRMAHEIIEKNKGTENLCLVGIQKGGVTLAGRLASQIEKIESRHIEVGTLDITFYRDDLNTREEQPVVKKTDIPCSINSKTVVLVDDVLFTGRSIRADYAGKNIPTSFADLIEVDLSDEDGSDKVVLLNK